MCLMGGTYDFPWLWHQDAWETIPMLAHPSKLFLMGEVAKVPCQI